MIERLKRIEWLKQAYRTVVRHPQKPPRAWEKALIEPVLKVEKSLYSRGVLSARSLTLPDFIGIGAQKSATTWLSDNLTAHPDVYVTRFKELHFFNWNFHTWTVRGYARNFREGRGKVKGEITPLYCAIPEERIRFLHMLMPKVKLLFMMRNPVERAWSQAVMELVREKKRAYEGVIEAEWLAKFRDESVQSLGDYIATVDSWTRVFPEEQLWIGLFDDVKERPRELLSSCFEFLGLSTQIDWDSFPYRVVINRGEGHPLPPHFREVLIDLYRDYLDALVDRFGPRLARWKEMEVAEKKSTGELVNG